MITEKDLQEAIAECQGKRKPAASDCIKLAAFYIIKDNLYPSKEIFPEIPTYSNSSGTIRYDGKTEFAEAIDGKNIDEVMSIMEDLMTALAVYNPKLYTGVMRQLE